jgi:SAM-dependent MidA family methyltransferase
MDTLAASTLSNLIGAQIVESSQQCMTFAEFMDLALYQPQHGYYATKGRTIGTAGDFFTSPHLGVDFGELLATQFIQMWEFLGYPEPFTLVEMGAGQGLLASDVLRYFQQVEPKLLRSLEYIIVERATPMIAAQQQQLQDLVTAGVQLSWRSLAEIPSNSITGCVFSNELVDALPVHQVAIVANELQEVYVTAAPNTLGQVEFKEVLADLSTQRLADYFPFVGVELPSIHYPDRYRTEVNLAALDWISAVGDRLQCGYVLTIDYGYSSDRYYSPRRSEGTLQCYYHHAHHSDPYCHVGEQDITAHVDFTALQRQGDTCGLRAEGLTKQGLFLMALGLGDRIADLRNSTAIAAEAMQAVLQRRDGLQRLLAPAPMGLGDFGVLVQSKGLDSNTPMLRGLTPLI